MIRKGSTLLPGKQMDGECPRHCTHEDRSSASRMCNKASLRRIGWQVDCTGESSSRTPDHQATEEASDCEDNHSGRICAPNRDEFSISNILAFASMRCYRFEKY